MGSVSSPSWPAWGAQPPRVAVMDGVITGLAQWGVRAVGGHGSLSCGLLGYSLWEGGVEIWGWRLASRMGTDHPRETVGQGGSED